MRTAASSRQSIMWSGCTPKVGWHRPTGVIDLIGATKGASATRRPTCSFLTDRVIQSKVITSLPTRLHLLLFRIRQRIGNDPSDGYSAATAAIGVVNSLNPRYPSAAI